MSLYPHILSSSTEDIAPVHNRWCLALVLSWLFPHVEVPKYIFFSCIKRLSAKSVNLICSKILGVLQSTKESWKNSQMHMLDQQLELLLKKVKAQHAVNTARVNKRLQLGCWKCTIRILFQFIIVLYFGTLMVS